MNKTQNINEVLHEFMGRTECGYCGHPASHHEPKCFGLGKITRDYCPCTQYQEYPYDTNLNAVAEVEAKVIEVYGAKALTDAVVAIFGEPNQERDNYDYFILPYTAPASVRAKACAAVVEGGEVIGNGKENQNGK